MPRVGSNSSSVSTPVAIQRAIVTFCWLPPDSRRTSPCARVSICSRSMAAATRAASSPHRDRRPSCATRAEQRQRDVLAHRPRHQQRMRPVARHQRQPRRDGIGGVAEGHGRAVDLDRARAGAAVARQHVEQLVLPLPFQRDDAQHLAPVQVERDIGQPRAGRQGPRTRSRGVPVVGRRRRRARRRRRPSTAPPSIISTIRSSIPGSMATIAHRHARRAARSRGRRSRRSR